MKRIVKRLLGMQGVALVLRLKAAIRLYWLRVAVKSPFLAKLHYLLFSEAFTREARAVIAGHLAFEENKGNAEPINYFLRRCIHRLEKGLIMRPRRAAFATDYIEATVDSYIAGRASLNEAEAAWAHDVLAEYFTIADGHPSIEKARARFERFRKQGAQAIDPSRAPQKPFLRKASDPPPVTFEALRDLSARRRSVRWFEQRPVPRELIDKAIEVSAMAPSACNRQPFEFRVFDEPGLVRRVADLPAGIKGYEHNIPVIAVLIGRLRAYPEPRDRHIIYIDASLAAMSFMYALETLGLSSCPINWPDIPHLESRMQSLLHLTHDERPIMCIAIGYPDHSGLVPNSSKVPLHALRSYNDLGSTDPTKRHK